jgi:serine/threonine protein kinase
MFSSNPDLEFRTSQYSARDHELIGKVLIGKFRLDEIVGVGGMATVFRATHLELNTPFAVKILSEKLSESPQFCQYFHDEAKKLAQVKHDHIVKISDVDTDPELGIHFFVMDYLEGSSLEKIIFSLEKYPRPWALSKITKIMGELTQALNYAHSKGFIHRDIKPANIFYTESGRAILTDFGIAITTKDAKLLSGITAGTFGYMSPEQQVGRAVDERSDIYSLAVVCYELLTGVRFINIVNGIGLDATLNKIETTELRDALERALSPDPNDRFTDAHEFGDAIRQSLLAARKRKKENEQRRMWWQRVRWAVTIAGLIVLLFAARWVYFLITFPNAQNAILYVVGNEKKETQNIWAMSPDGTNQRPVMSGTGNQIKPRWVPDRKSFVFTIVNSSKLAIQQSSYPLVIVNTLYENYDDADVSSKGVIALSVRGTTPKNWDVGVVVNGSINRLTMTPLDEYRPKWSPDGTMIAYTRLTSRGHQLYIVPADHSKDPKQITAEGDNYDPSWSPDGKTIVFTSTRNQINNLYIANPDGSNAHMLLDHPGDDHWPSWSPDGQQIAFSSNAAGNMDIYIVNRDGTGLKQITQSTVDEMMPSWGD